MKAYIAGKPLLSTTDWPSVVSCAVFFVGCNLRCRFCFNEPILNFKPQYCIDLEQIFTELLEQKFLIEGVIATGGEPTLQPNPLLELADWSHKHGILFGLMTNGTKPLVIRHLLTKKLLDYVAVDIKTVPHPEDYATITQSQEDLLRPIEETIQLLKSANIWYEFRTTLVPKLIDQPEQIRQIIEWVGTDHYVLQAFRQTLTIIDPQLQNAQFSLETLSKFRKFAEEQDITVRF